MSKRLGQYFTTNLSLKEKVFEYIFNKPEIILEPSFGQGDLVKYTYDKFHKNNDIKPSYEIFEIDDTIKLLDGLPLSDGTITCKYCDFLTQKIDKKYKTIIGNPPYVKTKTCNLYIDFIDKCMMLLESLGELIFIIPSDFFKLTMSRKLLIKLLEQGSFTHIYHPNDEKLFDNASIDVLIFRYVKDNKLKKQVIFDNSINIRNLHITNSDGLVTFTTEKQENMKKLEDMYQIYVGIVSGKDDIYKNDELGNISVLTGKDKISKFIYIDKCPSGNTEIDDYLLSNKDVLIKRRIRKFNNKNWFEWGAPRNITKMTPTDDIPCIYVSNITRKKVIAFKDKVQYFGGSLIMLKPKSNITDSEIDKTIDYLNSQQFRQIFTYSGRFKIGHRQLSKSFINI